MNAWSSFQHKYEPSSCEELSSSLVCSPVPDVFLCPKLEVKSFIQKFTELPQYHTAIYSIVKEINISRICISNWHNNNGCDTRRPLTGMLKCDI